MSLRDILRLRRRLIFYWGWRMEELVSLTLPFPSSSFFSPLLHALRHSAQSRKFWIWLTTTAVWMFRYHRARSPLYRPNCRRSHDSKGQHSSPKEWRHDPLGPRHCSRGAKAGPPGPRFVHGILQPIAAIWRRANAKRYKGSGCKWLHYG